MIFLEANIINYNLSGNQKSEEFYNSSLFLIPMGSTLFGTVFLLSLSLLRREVYGEFAAAVGFALHRDLPAGFGADFFDDGKPQAETAVFAAVRFIDGEKPREYFVHVFFGNAYACILDGERAIVESDVYLAAVLVILYRVAYEVAEKFVQPFVTRRYDHVVGDIAVDRDIAFLRFGRNYDERFADDRRKIDVVRRQIVVFYFAEIYYARDEVGEPFALRKNGFVRGFLLRFGHAAAVEKFGIAVYGRERGVHFVRDVGYELVFARPRLFDGCLFGCEFAHLPVNIAISRIECVGDGRKLGIARRHRFRLRGFGGEFFYGTDYEMRRDKRRRKTQHYHDRRKGEECGERAREYAPVRLREHRKSYEHAVDTAAVIHHVRAESGTVANGVPVAVANGVGHFRPVEMVDGGIARNAVGEDVALHVHESDARAVELVRKRFRALGRRRIFVGVEAVHARVQKPFAVVDRRAVVDLRGRKTEDKHA